MTIRTCTNPSLWKRTSFQLIQLQTISQNKKAFIFIFPATKQLWWTVPSVRPSVNHTFYNADGPIVIIIVIVIVIIFIISAAAAAASSSSDNPCRSLLTRFCMDSMDPDVHCPQKAIKLNHSLSLTFQRETVPRIVLHQAVPPVSPLSGELLLLFSKKLVTGMKPLFSFFS